MPVCAIGAGLIEQLLPDTFPERARPVEPDRRNRAVRFTLKNRLASRACLDGTRTNGTMGWRPTCLFQNGGNFSKSNLSPLGESSSGSCL
jgi:hypothetical protein